MQSTNTAGEPSRLHRLVASVKPTTGAAWWMYSWTALGVLGGIYLGIDGGSFVPVPVCTFIGFTIGGILLMLGKLAGITGASVLGGDAGDIFS